MLAAKEVSGKWVLIGRQSQYLHLLQGFQDCFRQRLQKMQMKKQGQHRTIWQEHSAKDFASYESYKRAGILYVFPPFITARMGQKIGRRPQTQLCGDAQEIRMPKKYVTSHHHSLNFVHYMAYIFSKD